MKLRIWGAFALLGCSLILCSAPAAGAPIVVRKSVRNNPTISCEVSGNPQLAEAVRRFVGVSGWFDLVRSNADYQLKVTSGGQTTVELSIGGAPIANWNISGETDARALAKKIVDLVIERSFKELKVKGFCHTKIAFCTETGKGVRNIYTCDIDGGATAQITRFNAVCVEPCWMPNAKSICYSRYTPSGLEVIETTVGKPSRSRVLVNSRGINSGVAVSPSGREMALLQSFDHQVDLYIMPLGGKQRIRLTKGIDVEASPCWNPAGNKLAFVSDSGGAPRIFICNRDGSGKKRLPSIGADAVTPDWSGDDRIVYAARYQGSYTLGVYDLKTNTNSKVTDEPGSYESPAWAPDNRQVVCKRTLGGKSSLVVVDTRTGRVRQLLNSPYNLSMPCWSPGDAK